MLTCYAECTLRAFKPCPVCPCLLDFGRAGGTVCKLDTSKTHTTGRWSPNHQDMLLFCWWLRRKAGAWKIQFILQASIQIQTHFPQRFAWHSETQLYDSSAETLTSRKLYGMFRIIAIAAVQFLCFLTPSRAIIERHPWTTKGMMLARLRLDLIHRSPRSTQLTLIFHKANMVGHRTQRLKVVWRSSMSGLRCKSLQATRQVSWTPHYSRSQQQIIHSF